MSKRISRLVATLVALPIAAGLVFAAQERQLEDKDLKDLGKKLAEYIEARSENVKVWEAETAVKESLVKLEKKLRGQDPLSSPADIGRALWMSKGYDKAKVKKGKVTEVESETLLFGEKEYEYALWAPAKYSGRTGHYPLILCIPDDERDTTPKSHLIEDWINPDIREGAIIVATPMPEAYGMWTVAGSKDAPGGIAYALTTFKDVSDKYAIDYDRVYIAGRGSGVAAAVAIAHQFPERFAGVIGRAGDVGDTPAHNFRNLPTYFTGAGAKATAFHEAIEAAGYKNCTIEPEGKEAEIWRWIQSHPRVSNPSEVTLVPESPFPNRAYWLQVPPSDGAIAARIDARIDRETNTITIDADGVAEVSLYFNDQLVDLSKPVKVVCNGAENLDQIPRSFKVAMEMIFKARSDPGKVFVASKSYTIPEKAAK